MTYKYIYECPVCKKTFTQDLKCEHRLYVSTIKEVNIFVYIGCKIKEYLQGL